MTDVDDMVLTVRGYLGVPYYHGSRDPVEGLDCLTFAEHVYREIGRRFPLPARYGPGSIEAEAFEEWAQFWEPTTCTTDWPVVEIEVETEGHAGVLLPPGQHVVHCARGVGVIVTKLHRFQVVRGLWSLRAEHR